MSLRPVRSRAPTTRAERVQIEHELELVRSAAHTLEERLDAVGWHGDRLQVHGMRDRAAAALTNLDAYFGVPQIDERTFIVDVDAYLADR